MSPHSTVTVSDCGQTKADSVLLDEFRAYSW
jgi:hypothetical protein